MEELHDEENTPKDGGQVCLDYCCSSINMLGTKQVSKIFLNK